jgi:polyisoprenyl-phosphate glycosyltransferase
MEPDISIVVACYNEQDVLPELCRRASAVGESLGQPYEIVLIDDGSKDSTWSIMQQAASADPHIAAVKLSRNHGHQLCLTAGLTICRGERILIIDADLQDPPELLPDMLKVMHQEHADVVYGKRVRREGETAGKRLSAYLFYRLIQSMTETPIPADTGDFRLMSRRALDVLLAMPERHRFIRGMVSWIGFKQVAFPYDRHARSAGRTKYPFRKMLKFAIDAITGFSIKPLTIANWIGLTGAALSMGLVVFAVWSWFKGGTVHGWASLLAGIGLIGSLQLLVLGIIGEYLGRLYEQSKGRPLFIIEEIVRTTEPTDSQSDQGKR